LILFPFCITVRLQRQKGRPANGSYRSALRPQEDFTMTIGRIARIALFASLAVLLSAFLTSGGGHPTAAAQPRSGPWDRHCTDVGGSIITNFGAVDANTTLGPVTGDLRGAVAATLLTAPQPGPNGTVIFHVQHHWVTESGDNLYLDPAVATTVPVQNSQIRFAIITYPSHITGGTGRFAGATGDVNYFGEADLVAGTALRYSGQVCFAEPDDR
jgi:hypothetical protein